ncbi:MAG: arginine--tRNA ligase, partial [Parcubacteria group bacterium]|nr:arginine--tRNA ligase [Parcubacteria group bacterium]
MITEEIKGVIKEALSKLDISVEDILLEHPADMAHGDYSTNVAMVVAKSEKKNPKDIAEEVVRYIVQNKHKLDGVERVEVAGAGFVNFYLTNEFFVGGVKDVLKERGNFGK